MSLIIVILFFILLTAITCSVVSKFIKNDATKGDGFWMGMYVMMWINLVIDIAKVALN